MVLARGVIVVLFASLCVADVFFSNPRGSNNRNQESTSYRSNPNRLMDTQNNANGGYCWGPEMSYYEGSKLDVEWTSEHGCGSGGVYCNVVLQYMCGPSDADATHQIRDGTSTESPPLDSIELSRLDENGKYYYGLHEPLEHFQACSIRSRNRGLFVADRALGLSAATRTRQNNNALRGGFECPEERDYYPYWHPSPWKDIAVLAQDTKFCDFYRNESQNVKGKGHCLTNQNEESPQNNEAECLSAGNVWKTENAWGIPAPDCVKAPYSPENLLGFTNTYRWTLPTSAKESCIANNNCNCVLRIRYNISSSALGENGNNPDSGFIDFKSNGVNSPVMGNPFTNQDGYQLQLRLNTAQLGRTFEDRSFIFHIKPSPVNNSSANIYNLNVKGKRGNVAQVFPAQEYGFSPEQLTINVGDFVHFQWTGCDTNPSGYTGSGRDQTDRSNIVQIEKLDSIYPASDAWLAGHPKIFSEQSTRRRMATLDQVGCKNESQLDQNDQEDPGNCFILNSAPAYFDGGIIQMKQVGSFYYMSTRNNNFSNRSHKGTVTVQMAGPTDPITTPQPTATQQLTTTESVVSSAELLLPSLYFSMISWILIEK